jgi:hypothetical protein
MSLNMPQSPKPTAYDPYLANANPQMYAAINAGNPAPEDVVVVNNIQKMLAIDLELKHNTDLNKAKDRYAKLDPAVQQGLQFLNPGADYLEPKKNFLGIFKEELVDTFKSPFRAVMNVAEQAINLGQINYKMNRNAYSAGANAPGGEMDKLKAQFEYFLKAKNWSDAWDGHNQWDSKVDEELKGKHGDALSFLVKAQIDGKKPGDVIREWGGDNIAGIMGAIYAMADYNSYLAYKAAGQEKDHPMSEDAKAYLKAKEDYYQHQRSFGRDITNWANRNHPPKDGGIWGNFLIPMLLSAPTLGGGGVYASKDGKRWLVENPNPFSKTAYVDPSGPLDAAWSIATDPLTWITGGSSKALTQSERLAENFIAAGKAGVATEVRVADLFANPSFYQAHDKMVASLNGLREARLAKSPEAGALYTAFAINFPKYDNPLIIDHLLTTKVLDDAGREVNVTDMDTLQRFFERGENVNLIVSGRVNNIGYYRENHVMLERSVRLGTDRVRAAWEKAFNGIDSTAPNGVATESSIAERAASIERVFGEKRLPGVLDDPEVDATVKELTRHGKNLARGYARVMAIHPENVQIFTNNDMVLKSLPAFRDFARVITGDKLIANMIAERFLSVDPAERVDMLYTMFKIYTDKIGLSATPEGLKRQKTFLDGVFGDGFGMGPLDEIVTPAHLMKDDVLQIPNGPSQMLHTTEGISMPRFEELHQELYETMGRGPLKFIRAFSYEKSATITGQLWTLAQLFPKLGIRGAVDEATVAFFTAAPRAIFDFTSGKGRAVSNVTAAYSASEKSIGMIKAMLLGKRNPARYVSARERELMQADVRVDRSYTRSDGTVVNRYEYVSADEYFGAPYEERLANKVIARFGGKLTDEEQAWLRTHLLNNSHSMESLAQSSVGATFGNTMVRGSMAEELYGKNAFARFLDERALSQTGEFRTIAMRDLSESSITEAHYDSFWRYFGKNAWSHGRNREVVDFGSLFFKNGALRTFEDGEAYVDDVMYGIGFTKKSMSSKPVELPDGYNFVKVEPNTGHGSYPGVDVVKDGKVIATLTWDPTSDIVEGVFVATKERNRGIAKALWAEAKKANPALRHSEYRTPQGDMFAHSTGDFVPELKTMGDWTNAQYEAALERAKIRPDSWMVEDARAVKAFVDRFSQTAQLRLLGKTDAEIAEGIIRKGRDELYTIFHGSPDAFNENLYNMIKFKMDEAIEKMSKSSKKSVTDPVARAKWEADLMSPSYHIRKTPFAEFEDVTRDFRFKGETLKTELDFKELGVAVEGQFAKFGRMAWEMMDRQINDLYRADAFAVKLLEQRAKMKPDELQYVEDLVKQGTTRSDAMLQADVFFDNRATSNAVDELMKYADNPAVRTQIAWNMRVVGRFNRANEDYYRRMYRYLKDHPDKVIYRAGHLNQAMDASGAFYEDDDGNQYILIPNDGVFWRTIAPAFAAIMNPLTTVTEVGKGLISLAKGEQEKAIAHFEFFKQPQWNQYTGKISMLNPSYSDSAGVVSLQGPTMAASVLGMRQLFNAVGQEKIGEELDNLLLGPVSDNTTWVRALLPSSITNQWAILDPQHRSGVYATSIMQAASFMQAHNLTRLNPEDYGNKEKLEQYYNRLGLTAHNVVAAKAGFNSWSGMPLGTTQPGISPELRRAGVVSFTQEFSDILRAVYEVNAEYGYQNADPIGVAVSAFVGSYPDRLIYTVSRDSKAAKTFINYTKETKNWALDSKKMTTRYGDVAFVFAPQVGKYDPAVARFMQASGLIPDANNPFIDVEGAQTSPLYRYLKDVAAVRARAEYFDLDRNLAKDLADPDNMLRNDPVYRQTMLDQTNAKKQQLLAGNPVLKYVLGTSEFATRELLRDRFDSLNQLVSDPDFISKNPKGDKGKLPEGARGVIQLMTKQVNSMMVVLEDKDIRSSYEGQLAVEKVYEDGIKTLKKLSVGQPTASEAYQSVIFPFLQDVYRIPTAGITK